MRLTIRYKGGSGSGNFGHSGRPGKVGGSADDGTVGAGAPTPVGKKRPQYDYWPRFPKHIGIRDMNRGYSEHTAIRSMLADGTADDSAIVMSAGSMNLAGAMAKYPDSGMYLARVRTNNGDKLVRFMGSFSDKSTIPQVGSRVVVGFDRGGGGAGYDIMSADVVADDGKKHALWFYD